MASTWSSLGIRLMTTGENANAWGDQTNQNWERLEDAADGLATVAVTGATTLTFTPQPTSYADENGRNKVLVFTGTAGGTQAITFPNIEKTYHVLNDSNSTLTLTTGTGAATVSLAAGKDKIIYNDGSDEIHDALANLSTTTLTLTGNADFDGDLDVDGTTNLDVVDIDGAVDMASTLQVDGSITSSDGATITTADNTDTLTLTSTDADQNQGPNLRLYRNSGSPADNDILGMIDFEGRNDNSQDYIAAQIETLTSDVSDGTEDAYMNISVMHAGTLRSRIEMDSGETVFNEASQDLDFRIESNGNDHMFFVDAGNNHINIGTATDLGGNLNVNGGIVVSRADNLENLILTSTDADANVGPKLKFFRDSSSPADNDQTGQVTYAFKNSAGAEETALNINCKITDVTDGTEGVQWLIESMTAGQIVNRLELDDTETVFNEDSVDVDFRVESDGVDKMLFVNAGTNSVSIGGEATPLGRLHVITADSGSSAHANADEFVIEGSAYSGMTIASGTTSQGTIAFGDSGDELAGRIIYNHSTNAMSFGTAGVGTQWSINSDGNLLPGNATSQGIHLGVTSAGAANLLDDYEEGTWTPSLSGTTGAASGVNFHARTGYYTKVGRHVFFTGYIEMQNFSSAPSGTAILTGLPFTVSNVSNNFSAIAIGYAVNWSSTDTPGGGYAQQNQTRCILKSRASADARDNLNANTGAGNMNGDEGLIFSGHYIS